MPRRGIARSYDKDMLSFIRTVKLSSTVALQFVFPIYITFCNIDFGVTKKV